MNEPELTPGLVAISVVVATAALLGVAVMSVRTGMVVLGVFALAGAAARLVTPRRLSFAVRSRAVDVTVLMCLAVALGYLALTTPLD